MRGLFMGTLFNENIRKWDVSNVITMSDMFYGCIVFNQDISRWNVSKVQYMRSMFYGCVKFNQDLSGWDVRNVDTTMLEHIFDGCNIVAKYKPRFLRHPNKLQSIEESNLNNMEMKTLRTPQLQSIEESTEEGGARKKRTVKRRKNRYSRKHNVGIR